jgi:hypothetical protein
VRSSPRARRAWRTGAASCCVVLGVVGPSNGFAASAGGVAVGTATASGVRSTYDVPGFLVVDRLYDDGGPVAQSVLNSSGGATGFASLPYPGDTVVNAPALLSVGTGQPFPFTYPLYVIADGVLTPTAHAQDPSGAVDLTATAADLKTTAKAKGNGPQSGNVNTSGSVSATSVVIDADGAMTAIADNVTRGIDLGVLKVAEVHTRSVTTLKPGDNKPSTKTATDIAGASVAGQAVTITKDGITLAGTQQGAPYKPIVDNLNAVLVRAGISVALVGDTPVSGGQSSSGLEIVHKAALPLPGSPAGTERTVIGNAMSLIVGGSAALPSGPPAGGTTGPVSPPTTGTGAVPPSGGGSAGPAPTGVLPPTGSVSIPQSGSAPSQPVISAPSAQGSPLLAADLSSNLGFFYLVIALGGGIALMSSIVWRAKGVRAQWTS